MKKLKRLDSYVLKNEFLGVRTVQSDDYEVFIVQQKSHEDYLYIVQWFRNKVVRGHLKIKPVMTKVRREQLKWFGHLMRLPVDSALVLVRAYYEIKLEETPWTPKTALGK